MPVHLIQLLCPQRHAIVALAYEADGGAEGDKAAVRRLKLQWTGMVASGGFNPWCGVCGSREMHCEGAPTKFKTLKEAAPFLREEEGKNMLARSQVGQGETEKT